ncbi:MAG TPA: ribosome biogenesis GTP-binding protein YihA/YsxC [Steroidobacteraceae bacterium]|jgi:GTP-binding protein|nr:ribosome biogenesis GTP-binding protein YihA/YsxC [Steroidobacteraceae bacterium]
MSSYPRVRFLLSAASASQFPADVGGEVAVAGRSNAGKSSAINSLTQRNNLARSGKTPGLTQLINFFELDAGRRLVDLPGYGFAKVPPKVQARWHQLVGEYFATRNSLTGLLLIVDVRRGLKDEDRALLDWSNQRALPVHVLLSKSDKLGRNDASKALQSAERELGERASVQLFSSLNQTGAEHARRVLEALLENKKPGGSGGRATGSD